MGKLSQEELEMVYKIGFKPTDYLPTSNGSGNRGNRD